MSRHFITKSIVANMAPGAAPIWDTGTQGVSGLHVKAGAQSKTYWLKTRFEGQQRLIKIGRTDAWSPKEARLRAQELQRDIDKGIDPTLVAAMKRQEPTVREMADIWMGQIRAEKSESTITTYGDLLRRFILPAVGAMKARAVTDAEMKRLHRSMATTPTQANLTLRVASALFTWAEDSEQGFRDFRTNPCGPVKKRMYKERQRHHIFEQDALTRFSRVLAEMRAEGVSLYALGCIELIALTGCRKSEMLSARRDNLKRFTADGKPAGKITLASRKSGGIPFIHLGEHAMEVIDQLPEQEDNPYLICGFREGEHLSTGNLTTTWMALRERADLKTEGGEWVRLHDLRHNYGGTAHAMGESIANIGRQMGHRSLEQTQRYVMAAETAVQESSERVGGQIGDALRDAETPEQPTEPPARSADIVPLRKRA